MQTVNDWMFAIGTAAVPLLTFVTTMYLLIKLHFLNEAIIKIETVQQQQSRDLIDLAKAIGFHQGKLNETKER